MTPAASQRVGPAACELSVSCFCKCYDKKTFLKRKFPTSLREVRCIFCTWPKTIPLGSGQPKPGKMLDTMIMVCSDHKAGLTTSR